MNAHKFLAALSLVMLLAVVTALVWRLHGCPQRGIDDANIFFTYAENIASGNGITYAHNGQHVEGFTSMLWMLVCSAMFALGLGEAGVFVCCFLLFVLTQVILVYAIRRSHPSIESQHTNLFIVGYVVLMVSSPAYIAWMTISLMDTCLWGFVVAAMTFFLILPPRSKVEASIAVFPFLAASAVRPEGFAVAPVFVALLWLRCRTIGFAYATRLCLVLLLSILAGTVALTVFRVQYFGYPLPNTYYAKVSPSFVYNLREGKEYLYEYMLSSPVVSLCCLVLVSNAACWAGQLLGKLQRSSLKKFSVCDLPAHVGVSVGAITLLIVPVVTGGDHFAMFRFFQPVYPVMCVGAILSARELLVRCRIESFRLLAETWRLDMIRSTLVAIVLAYWFFAYSGNYSWSSMRWGSPLTIEFAITEGGMATGRRLDHIFRGVGRLPSIGVITAGGIARTYKGYIVDLMGLNNSFIGHFKGQRRGKKNHAAFERDAFFKVEPDILVAVPPIPPATNNFENECLKGLLEDARFTDAWRFGRLSRTGEPACSLDVFVRRAFLDELQAETAVEFQETMIWSNRWMEVQVASGLRK